MTLKEGAPPSGQIGPEGVLNRDSFGPEEAMKKVEMVDVIVRLLSVHKPKQGLTSALSAGEITYLLWLARDTVKEQSVSVEIEPPVNICGDTHGQYSDLLRLFNQGGFPPLTNYLFLGDYVDRGKQNLETIILLLAYKVRHPKNFFLLRGNHECASINKVYGFYEECARRYNPRVWLSFQDTFAFMPLTAIVGDRILCMHGGLSPKLKSLKQLRGISRPIEPLGDSMEMDLLWADPVAGITGFQANPRGASFGFGSDVLLSFCDKAGIDLVARAHQVAQDGYEFFAGRRLVTIFSAPHYCGQFDNAAAMMVVDENLKCSFEVLRPNTKKSTTKGIPTGGTPAPT